MKKKGRENSSSKVKQQQSTIAIDATASSLAKGIRDFSTAGTNRACSNRESRKNKCGYGEPESTGRICAYAQSICHGDGL